MVKINIITQIVGFEKLLNEAIGTLISSGKRKWLTYTNSHPGRYLTHAQNHITRAVETLNSRFALFETHKRGVDLLLGFSSLFVFCFRQT